MRRQTRRLLLATGLAMGAAASIQSLCTDRYLEGVIVSEREGPNGGTIYAVDYRDTLEDLQRELIPHDTNGYALFWSQDDIASKGDQIRLEQSLDIGNIPLVRVQGIDYLVLDTLYMK